mmetsp:Transcript_25223/g.42257  ORF Transcript_25223/g.42257 Transcript_25223/m.42257 type:complete len:155 (+) Transcript_25223:131-595(+)
MLNSCDMDDLVRFRGPAMVTVAYFIIYYCFLFGQAVTTVYLFSEAKSLKKTDEKITLGAIKYGPRKDKRALCVDRAVGNTLEQMLPFLVSLWLCAWLGDAELATTLGWYYVAFRVVYPACWWFGRPYLFLSTIPNYLCIWYMGGIVAYKAYSAR